MSRTVTALLVLALQLALVVVGGYAVWHDRQGIEYRLNRYVVIPKRSLDEAAPVLSVDLEAQGIETERAGRIFLVRRNDGSYLALSDRRGGAHCAVQYHEEKSPPFYQPCTDLYFDRTGQAVRSGAVPRDMARFRVEPTPKTLRIDLYDNPAT